MRLPETVMPLLMTRVAIVAPQRALRSVLVAVADGGVVQLDKPTHDTGTAIPLPAAAGGARVAPMLSPDPPDADECRRLGRFDLLRGEAELGRYLAGAALSRQVAALSGWMPEAARPALSARLGQLGGSVVPLPRPRGVDPPSQIHRTGWSASFAPLVDTYGVVPYSDVDPTLLAGLAYVAMFGIMFADAGHGALLLIGALLLWRRWPQRAAKWRQAWPFLAGAGLASTLFGLLYGEFFGPTGVVPVVWLKPLDHPVPLLVSGVGVGAVLLAAAYVLGVVNRVREGGWPLALYAPSGVAGATLFLAVGLISSGWYLALPALLVPGLALAVAALLLAFVGFAAGAGGGGAGLTQSFVELFDLVIRLGSNLLSFARLAAFGLTHAALGELVWNGARGLWRHGGWLTVVAVVLFAVGNALTFALEALVAGIQALRLEYYELFSRVFQGEGRPFEPWHVPLSPGEVVR
jgi:V/A-type H+-transporting ATPase subunit I